MNGASLWLGRLQAPVRVLAVGFSAATLALFAWLVLRATYAADPTTMHEMIRPTGNLEVQAMLVLLTGAVGFGSLYFSDFKGAIEAPPHGFFDIASLVLGRISMVLVVAIVIVMFYEVVLRYVFSAPTLWANELSLWMAGFLFLLAGLYAMQQRSHIRIYVIYDVMPRWAQKTSDVISVALIWAFTFALVWGGYNDAEKRFLRGEGYGTVWDPPIPATIKPAILIIVVLVALQALSNLIADWNKAPEHHSPLDEIDETEIENIRKTLKED